MVGSIKNFTGQKLDVSKGITEAKDQVEEKRSCFKIVPPFLDLRLMLY